MKLEYTKYEVRLLIKGFCKRIYYRKKEEALKAMDYFKENEDVSKVRLFKVTEKYESIDI